MLHQGCHIFILVKSWPLLDDFGLLLRRDHDLKKSKEIEFLRGFFQRLLHTIEACGSFPDSFAAIGYVGDAHMRIGPMDEVLATDDPLVEVSLTQVLCEDRGALFFTALRL
jgi:hypothetical protein